MAMLRCGAQMQVQARTEGADGGSCGGGGMHRCMARKRSVWGSVAGHVCAAAGLGATGEERRRTTTSTGGSSCRSMRHERDVDLGLEDVQIGVDEPPEKKPGENKQSSLRAWLVSVMAPPTPKSADLTKQGKARKQNITEGIYLAGEVHSSPTVAGCMWRCWENSKWDAGSPRLPQV